MEHEGRWTLIGLVRPFHASWARYQLKRQDVRTSARPRPKGSGSSRHIGVVSGERRLLVREERPAGDLPQGGKDQRLDQQEHQRVRRQAHRGWPRDQDNEDGGG